VVALALGLFAALLTAMTLVILLTLDVDSRWPSLPDVVAESYLVAWFVLAMTAVTLAAFVDDAKPKWLTTLAITLSLASGILGSLSLFHLLHISTGEGRQQYLGYLLATKLNQPGVADGTGGIGEASTLRPFLDRFQACVDVGDVSALRERVAEISVAGGTGTRTNPEALLALDVKLLRDLSRAILLGRISSPEVGTVTLPRLGEVMVSHVLSCTARVHPGRPVEQGIAAAYLGEAARCFAWLHSAAYREAVEKGDAPPELCAAAAGAVVARDHILDVVDPQTADAASALPDGLTDPTAVLTWWWCFCDFNGSHDGRAFYAVLWMLTGEKFFGTFGWGNRYLLSELNDRLADGSTNRRRLNAQAVIASVGGVPRVALELLATSLASWRDRRLPIPEGFEQNWSYWDDPVRLARRTRLFLPREDEPWISTAAQAIEATATLLASGASHGGLAALVARSLGRLRAAPRLPVVAPQRRPAATVLAVCLHLAPRDGAGSLGELERFLNQLPAPLVAGAAQLAEAILHVVPSTAVHLDPKMSLLDHLDFLLLDQQTTT
jgi:hypothetical protein